MRRIERLRVFSPNSVGDPVANAAAGRVLILKRVERGDMTQDIAPLYRVRNVDNGVEAFAFGDELTSSER